jgi:hypothetical protein
MAQVGNDPPRQEDGSVGVVGQGRVERSTDQW